MNDGLWSLWAKGCAVDNGFIVIHGKRPGSPQANCPQIHRPLWFRFGSSKSPGAIKPVPKHGAPSRFLTDNPNGCWGL